MLILYEYRWCADFWDMKYFGVGFVVGFVIVY